MKIAKIIVDVPTRQTDRPFDYLIPEHLSNVLPGCRVVVGFGHRKVTGFVLEIVDQSDFSGSIKPIDDLIDEKPVLNEEQLKLAEFLSKEYFTFLISNLWLMLPNMLKGKTTKYLQLNRSISDSEINELFVNSQVIPYQKKQFTPGLIKKIEEAIEADQLRIVYQQSRKVTHKSIQLIRTDLSDSQIDDIINNLAKNSKYERIFWQTVLQEAKILPIPYLTKEIGIPRTVINRLAKKDLLEIFTKEVYRDPLGKNFLPKKDLHLEHTPDQIRALKEIEASFDQEQVFLLQGVTGSGKTEIYRTLCEKVIDRGQRAMMLVPEISLTPQMIDFFTRTFHERIAILHSKLSSGEQYDEWRRIQNDEVDLILGVRSAILAPVHNLGLIIVDEEHEKSYRQLENPQYDAREIAQWRARYDQIPIVFGSATPTLTSRAKAQRNVFKRIVLPNRVNKNGKLPMVQVLDLRDPANYAQNMLFTPTLKDQILDRFAKKEQTILFLNRRGYASFIECRDCGNSFGCPNCDVSLTLHLSSKRLICHYCGFSTPIPKSCPNCGSHDLRSFGEGTERVEKEIKKLDPNIRTIRMDKDTTSKKGSYQKIISSFENHEADVLIGTQSVAKGLNFPKVTLVGVLNADISLNRPEYDASEMTFDLLTQVAGRAGRGDISGSVIIQTYNPDHYSIKDAQKQDYETFFRQEMQIRKLYGYLPYFYTIFIKVTSSDEMVALKEAMMIGTALKNAKNNTTQILGPAPFYIKRINNEFTYQLSIKYKKDEALKNALQMIIQKTQKDAKRFKINISHIKC